MDKKNILTYEGLKKLEDELENLKVVPQSILFCLKPLPGQVGGILKMVSAYQSQNAGALKGRHMFIGSFASAN